MSSKPLEILKKYWSYDQFRNPQDLIIDEILNNKDCLALLPTGGGKSVCYQVPALVMDGVVIVVSPLIALMKDQVFQLKKRKIAAEAIYSGLHPKEIDRILDNCIYGDIKLLYVSPERLQTTLFIERFKKMNVSFIAVDEAHCISQWGYDFRPSYLNIAEIRQLKPNLSILALTATATKEVAKDIQEKLTFKTKNLIQQSFHRPNLNFAIIEEEQKEKYLLHLLKRIEGSALVYTRSRANTQVIATFLSRKKISASFYHAGMDAEQRSKVQEDWINNKKRVIVATNAFGMGIDKSDVRLVVHINLPPSPEEYFQEAGRAGRDQEDAFCVLLFNEKDKSQSMEFFRKSFPSEEYLRKIYKSIGVYLNQAIGSAFGESFDFNIGHFADNYRYDYSEVYHALRNLEKSGYLSLTEGVFQSSTVYIKKDKEALYNYQIQNETENRILKIILRIYEGLFRNNVKISEFKIASLLKIPIDQVKMTLTKMHKEDLIEYHQASKLPQLTFLTERLPSKNLNFDKALLSFRKKEAKKRMQNMLEFLNSTSCRVQFLLNYFDEKLKEECGKCDVCLGSKKVDLSTHDFEKIKAQLTMLLNDVDLRPADLNYYFPFNKKARVLKAIEFLENESYIKLDNGKLVLTKQGDR